MQKYIILYKILIFLFIYLILLFKIVNFIMKWSIRFRANVLQIKVNKDTTKFY
jgi:hypothetical protein